jgi:excisionase family DNA binding protein
MQLTQEDIQSIHEQLRGLTLFLTGDNIAEILGISRSLAYRYMKDGTLPTVRIKRMVRVPREALLEWAKVNTRPGAVAAK